MANKKKTKPQKPYPDFPLTAHSNGQWAKKIKGKRYYFGVWSDSQTALQRYLTDRDNIIAGKEPSSRISESEKTVRLHQVVNSFLYDKESLVEAGEIKRETFAEYRQTCEMLGSFLGRELPVETLGPEDFTRLRVHMAKRWGPVALGNQIQRVRSVFKYAYESAIIKTPVKIGPNFSKPSQRVLRKTRAGRNSRVFDPKDLRNAIIEAQCPLKAMILLGINCAFGNTDIATLPLKSVNLKTGWINYPRPKTGVPRKCPLWSTTIRVIKQSLKQRPKPTAENAEGLLFVTRRGLSYAGNSHAHRRIAGLMRDHLVSCDIKRPGLSFYSLRHTFETVAGESRDQVAVDAIMGHAPSVNDMSAVYRHRISESRLLLVVQQVEQWLALPQGAS